MNHRLRFPTALAIPGLGAAVLLALTVGSSLVSAQVIATPATGASLVSGSVFGPHSTDGGGQYHGPGDAGGPGGSDGVSGTPDNPNDHPGQVAPPTDGSLTGGPHPGGATAGGSGAPAAPASTGHGESPKGPTNAVTGSATSDSWANWWEANKFDFIQLRRVGDARTGGPGVDQETAGQREMRLANLRASIRQQILPVLRDLTRSDDGAVRAAAIVSLGKLHDEESVDLASRMLADSNSEVRRSAMLSLGVQNSGRASWLLMNVADDNKTGRSLLNNSPIPADDRGTALLSATLRGDMSAEQLLIDMLGDRKAVHGEFLAMVADAAGLMGSTDALRPLIDLAFDNTVPQYVRSAAISALGRIGDPSVAGVLIGLLDQDVEPRRAAIVALGQVVQPGSSRVVINRLATVLDRDPDATSRHFAAIAMGRIGGAESLKALAAALPKARDDSRSWIELGIGLCEHGTPTGNVVPLLLEQLKRETSVETQGACLIAIGLCGSDHGLTELTSALKRGPVGLAGYAAMALGLSGQPAAASALGEALAGSNNPLVLRQAALALGILGDTSAIPALLDLIRTTKNPFVASYAAIGIAFMGDSNAAGPLLDLIQREGPRGVTTTYAVAAVGQLFDQDRRPALSHLAAGDNYLARVTAVNDLLGLGF